MIYTPLYIKTDYSLLTSLIKIDDLIEFALKNNIKSLSITDDNLCGVIEFYNKCINNNIKPIIGLELKIKDVNLVLYCKNYNGYINLIKIMSLFPARGPSWKRIAAQCSSCPRTPYCFFTCSLSLLFPYFGSPRIG